MFLVFCANCNEISAERTVSPLQYGLNNAKTDIEKYWILLKTHSEAVKIDATVSYRGIKSLHIQVPQDAEPIPLTNHTDFCNLELYVRNDSNDTFLFKKSDKSRPLSILKDQIDRGFFDKIDELKKGLSLLLVTDKNLWVKKRVGKNYGHVRKDIIVVKSGKALNKTISLYDNEETNVEVEYIHVNKSPVIIENLQLFREKECSNITNLLFLENQYNVHIRNVKITTPEDTMVNDHQFYIRYCAKVKFDNVTINGTYSRENHSGYGIYLDTVYDVSFNQLKAHGKWGVFGTVNVNNIKLSNCDINRFDIHCYGRDVFFKNCFFRNLHNSFTSVMGTVSFKECEFINFVPFSFRGDYNAFTPFNLVFKCCKFHVANSARNYLINARSLLESLPNDRTELQNVRWPNVIVDRLTIIRDNGYNGKVYLYNLGNSYNKRLIKEIPSGIVINDIFDSYEKSN